MKEYIVEYRLNGKIEQHEIWASSAHNAEQMTIGWLQRHAPRTISNDVIVKSYLKP